MPIIFKQAQLAEVPSILELMSLYYEYDHLKFDPTVAKATVTQLILQPELGHLWVVREGALVIGYCAVTFGFSLEFGGKTALIDELFILEEFRSKGIGSQAIQHALEESKNIGIRTTRLEVTERNSRALKLYKKLGFEDLGRSVLVFRK